MSLWFMVLITIVTGAYKPINITGGPHIVGMAWNYRPGGPQIFFVSKIEPFIKVGVPSFLPVSHSEMAMAISYNWL